MVFIQKHPGNYFKTHYEFSLYISYSFRLKKRHVAFGIINMLGKPLQKAIYTRTQPRWI